MRRRDILSLDRDPDFYYVGTSQSADNELIIDPPVYDLPARDVTYFNLLINDLSRTVATCCTDYTEHSVPLPAPAHIGTKRICGELTVRTLIDRATNRQKYAVYFGQRWLGHLFFDDRPARETIRNVWRAFYDSQPAPRSRVPDTLGWRSWVWDGQHLISPSWGVAWHSSELRCDDWSDDSAVRGKGGIHALFVPRSRRTIHIPGPGLPGADVERTVTGIVERYGKFVQGEDGWRAEWVFIRELFPRNPVLAEKLRAAYPDVKITLRDDGAGYWENDAGKAHYVRSGSIVLTSPQPSASGLNLVEKILDDLFGLPGMIVVFGVVAGMLIFKSLEHF